VAALHVLAVLVLIPAAVAQDMGHSASKEFSEFDGKEAFDYSQQAIGGAVSDYTFLSPDGRQVRLSDYLGRPVVISLIYTSCYHTCPMITSNLINVLEGSENVIDPAAYSLLTIGFDTRVDTPATMGRYAKEHGIDAFANWHVLSTDEETMAALAKDLGFIYYPSPNGFDHLAQTTILTPEGEVYRQIYTPNFEAPFLIEPLKELIFGTGPRIFQPGHFIAQVKLFCTFYDPKTGRYRFDYSLFIALIIGSLSLLGIAVFLVREWFFKKRA